MIEVKTVNRYNPDEVSAPGETLLEILEERGISQAELAERTNRPKKTINEIIKGKTAITPDTALQLELALGVSATFWNDFECRYREYLARVEQTERLEQHLDWVDPLPTKEMTRLGWIKPAPDKLGLLREILHFFGVASPRDWTELGKPLAASYRQSKAFEANSAAIAAWLRQGHIVAQSMQCDPYDVEKFRTLLPRLRPLTRLKPTISTKKLISECASCGVAVVIIPQLSGTRLSGAARWISPHRAVIQLSDRYKRNDQFWFTFFHEAGHIILHGKRDMFLDTEFLDDEKEERQANDFAANLLIPAEAFKDLLRNKTLTALVITQFADRIDVAPGIVVGRLQHEGKIPWRSSLNSLKEDFSLN